MLKSEALDLLQSHQSDFEQFGVKRLGLFGSFVRETQRPDSDLDLLVEFKEGEKTFDNFIQLCFFLENLLQRPVELVTPESLSPYIGPRILKEVEYVAFAN